MPGLQRVVADPSRAVHVGEAYRPLHADPVVLVAGLGEHLAEVVVERMGACLDLFDGGALHDAVPLFPDDPLFGALGSLRGYVPVLAFDQEHPVFPVVQDAVHLVVYARAALLDGEVQLDVHPDIPGVIQADGGVKEGLFRTGRGIRGNSFADSGHFGVLFTAFSFKYTLDTTPSIFYI